MLQKWKNALDKNKSVRALFNDLSKAFDTINQEAYVMKLRFWVPEASADGPLIYKGFSIVYPMYGFRQLR